MTSRGRCPHLSATKTRKEMRPSWGLLKTTLHECGQNWSPLLLAWRYFFPTKPNSVECTFYVTYPPIQWIRVSNEAFLNVTWGFITPFWSHISSLVCQHPAEEFPVNRICSCGRRIPKTLPISLPNPTPPRLDQKTNLCNLVIELVGDLKGLKTKKSHSEISKMAPKNWHRKKRVKKNKVPKEKWRKCKIWMFPKIGVPQIIHFNRVFHYKPSIFRYPCFWKHPYVSKSMRNWWSTWTFQVEFACFFSAFSTGYSGKELLKVENGKDSKSKFWPNGIIFHQPGISLK